MPTTTNHIITNEVMLQDSKNMKLSFSFGEANTSSVYKYAMLNFKTTMPGSAESKITVWSDKDIFNFSTLQLKHRDGFVWTSYQQGPDSGMNSDMIDGYHGYQLKNALGANNFMHAFQASTASVVGNRKYVKLLTFKPSRIGNPTDFKTNGSVPYEDINAALENQLAREQFTQEILNNPKGVQSFTTTNSLKYRILNAMFRGTVSFLNSGKMESVDIHVGLFEDPLSRKTDNSSVEEMFFISNHGTNLPYLSDFNGTPKPPVGYVTKFPQPSNTTKSYQLDISTFKLIAGPTTVQTIDGINIYTHHFELYMAVDKKTELHINPYCSAQCIIHEYQPPVDLSTLSTDRVAHPRNINDLRYSDIEHRHYDYEKVIDDIHNIELPKKVDKTDSSREGSRVIVSNASKTLEESTITTTELSYLSGTTSNVQSQINSKVSTTDNARAGSRVMVVNNLKTIVESGITTTELDRLQGVSANVQTQINDIDNKLVKKAGDTMTGDLNIQATLNASTLKQSGRELRIVTSLPSSAPDGTVVFVV